MWFFKKGPKDSETAVAKVTKRFELDIVKETAFSLDHSDCYKREVTYTATLLLPSDYHNCAVPLSEGSGPTSAQAIHDAVTKAWQKGVLEK